MIQAPGLNPPGSGPPWLSKIQIIEFTGWTEDEYFATSVDTLRQIITYLRGINRGYEQKERKARMRAESQRSR